MIRSLVVVTALSLGASPWLHAQRRGDIPIVDTTAVRPCDAVDGRLRMGGTQHAAALALEFHLPSRWHRDTIIRDASGVTERWAGPAGRRLVLTSATDSAARQASVVGRYYTNMFRTPSGDTVISGCSHCGEPYVRRCVVQGAGRPSLLAYVRFRAALAPARDTWVRTWAGSDDVPWIFASIVSPDSADQAWAQAVLLTARLGR